MPVRITINYQGAESVRDFDTDKLIYEDKMKNRMKVFYEPINTWTDLVMFNFLMDRAAGHQLRCCVSPLSLFFRQSERIRDQHSSPKRIASFAFSNCGMYHSRPMRECRTSSAQS